MRPTVHRDRRNITGRVESAGAEGAIQLTSDVALERREGCREKLVAPGDMLGTLVQARLRWRADHLNHDRFVR